MHLFLLLLTAIILSVITYQDFRYRAVSWIYFPLLAIMGGILAYYEMLLYQETLSVSTLAIYFAINLSFLLLQLGLLKGYFFLRSWGKDRMLSNKIGWGDLLFLVAACFFFSPINFLIYYTVSLLFALGFHILIVQRKSSPHQSIPLAGLQAAFLLCLIATAYFFRYPLNNDNLLISKLNNQ